MAPSTKLDPSKVSVSLASGGEPSVLPNGLNKDQEQQIAANVRAMQSELQRGFYGEMSNTRMRNSVSPAYNDAINRVMASFDFRRDRSGVVEAKAKSNALWANQQLTPEERVTRSQQLLDTVRALKSLSKVDWGSRSCEESHSKLENLVSALSQPATKTNTQVASVPGTTNTETKPDGKAGTTSGQQVPEKFKMPKLPSFPIPSISIPSIVPKPGATATPEGTPTPAAAVTGLGFDGSKYQKSMEVIYGAGAHDMGGPFIGELLKNYSFIEKLDGMKDLQTAHPQEYQALVDARSRLLRGLNKEETFLQNPANVEAYQDTKNQDGIDAKMQLNTLFSGYDSAIEKLAIATGLKEKPAPTEPEGPKVPEKYVNPVDPNSPFNFPTPFRDELFKLGLTDEVKKYDSVQNYELRTLEGEKGPDGKPLDRPKDFKKDKELNFFAWADRRLRADATVKELGKDNEIQNAIIVGEDGGPIVMNDVSRVRQALARFKASLDNVEGKNEKEKSGAIKKAIKNAKEDIEQATAPKVAEYLAGGRSRSSLGGLLTNLAPGALVLLPPPAGAIAGAAGLVYTVYRWIGGMFRKETVRLQNPEDLMPIRTHNGNGTVKNLDGKPMRGFNIALNSKKFEKTDPAAFQDAKTDYAVLVDVMKNKPAVMTIQRAGTENRTLNFKLQADDIERTATSLKFGPKSEKLIFDGFTAATAVHKYWNDNNRPFSADSLALNADGNVVITLKKGRAPIEITVDLKKSDWKNELNAALEGAFPRKTERKADAGPKDIEFQPFVQS